MKNVISRVKGSQPAPILLVANKLDLECQREVATSEGKQTDTIRKTFFYSGIVNHKIAMLVVFVEHTTHIDMLCELLRHVLNTLLFGY